MERGIIRSFMTTKYFYGGVWIFQSASRCGGVKISIITASKDLMKLILILLLPVLAFADPASSIAGKNASLRDEKGKSTTTASTSGSKTTFRDAQGRMTRTATQSSSGTTTFRNAQGRRKYAGKYAGHLVWEFH